MPTAVPQAPSDRPPPADLVGLAALLAGMGHELRTPLNTILGYSQLLLREDTDEATLKRRLRAIQESGEHLLCLINELMDLSRVETGKIRIEPRPINVGRFLGSLAEEGRLQAGEKGLRFELCVEGLLPRMIYADPVRLRQVLHNLLSNAFKFTAAGAVLLRVRIDEGRLRLEVIDSGKGIAPADLPRLFEPFYQASEYDPTGSGLGLGLYIARRLAELMGGRIWVESQPGHGSRFTCELPVSEVDEPTPELTRMITGYAGRCRAILVVDDDATSREVLRGMLTGVGFEVLEAATAAEANALLSSSTVAIAAVISDTRVATLLAGKAWCRQPRAKSGWGRKPAMVACSARVLPEDRQQARAAGFEAFVPKPVQAADLFAVLGRCLKLTWTYADSKGPGREETGAKT
ncbi:MAG: response regulator, partial [Verrucomicrobia bacterium]|nr:response regulator [Verrucomicrobiota bacterium]